jgi:hypothetical protein
VSARSRIPVALVLATLTAVSTAPVARASWTVPITITGDAGTSAVRAAGAAGGREAFAWIVTTKHVVRTSSQRGPSSYLRARARLPHGRVGTAQSVSSTRGIVTGAQIGLDAAGDAIAVWVQAGAHLSIMGAYRPHGKRFGKPFELGRSTHFDDARPVLAVGPSGDAAVAWNQGGHVQVVRRNGPASCPPSKARGCFSQPVSLRSGSDQTVAIGPLGSAYVAWAAGVHGAGTSDTQLRMVVVRRSAKRSTDHAISGGGDASRPALAVRPNGTAILAWRASLPAGGEQDEPAAIMAATSSPDAVATAPQTITAGTATSPMLALDSQGEAILAWSAFDATPGQGDGPQVLSAVAPAGSAAFGAPAAITPGGFVAENPSLAVDGAGAAYVVYDGGPAEATTPGGRGAFSNLRPADGTFGAAIPLPAQLAVAPAVLAAGAQVSALGFDAGGRPRVSDWTP